MVAKITERAGQFGVSTEKKEVVNYAVIFIMQDIWMDGC